MPQYKYAVDPNAIDKQNLQKIIDYFNGITGSDVFLNITNARGKGNIIYITDNHKSPLLAKVNRTNIAQTLAGLNSPLTKSVLSDSLGKQ